VGEWRQAHAVQDHYACPQAYGYRRSDQLDPVEEGAGSQGCGSDAGYVKPIHQHAAMAKVKFVPVANNGYTGLFQGSNFGLLRLSVTEDPAQGAFTAGPRLEGLCGWQAV
jgi:hypothetical protein